MEPLYTTEVYKTISNRVTKEEKMIPEIVLEEEDNRVYIIAGSSGQSNVIPCNGPYEPTMGSKVAREKTFEETYPKCCSLIYKKKSLLAEAGFFYSGQTRDHVSCFA